MIENLPAKDWNGKFDFVGYCYICGASQALWILNSKPAIDSPQQPFFPFLQYQIQEAFKATKLNSNGQCLVCNICYILLLQQWKLYENKNTPLMKRLYWMKRPPNEYKNILENSVLPSDHEQSLVDSNFGTSVAVKLNVIEANQNSQFFTCYLCSHKGEHKLSSIVYTSPQESEDVPFFSNIIKERDKELIDSNEGKVLLCKQCSSKLHQQWVEFQTQNVPISKRKYIVNSWNGVKYEPIFTCCLCRTQLSQDHRHLIYYKPVNDKPYYPFLSNFKPEALNGTFDSNSYTFCCRNCNSLLYRQWGLFEKNNVPQEERVYQTFESESPLPIIRSKLESLRCRICSDECEKVFKLYTAEGIENQPCFPCLKCFNEDDKNTVDVCKFCWANALGQLELYKEHSPCESLSNFKLSCEKYLCGQCNRLFEKSKISLLRKDNKKESHLVCKKCENEDAKVHAKDNTNEIDNSTKDSNSQIEKEGEEEFQGRESPRESPYPEYKNDTEEIYEEVKESKNSRKEEEVLGEDIEEGDIQGISIETEDSLKEIFIEDSGHQPDMKATATVSPFFNFNMRNHPQEQTPPTSEGGFAAALRKLAQQAPGGFPSQLFPREPIPSPPGKVMKLKPGESMVSHSGVRISGTPSIIAPPPHPLTFHAAEKQDLLLKTSHSHMHPRSEHMLPPHPSLPRVEEGKMKHHSGMVHGMFQYNAERENHMRRQSQETYEGRSRSESFEHHGTPATLPSNGIKERPSVGLVHPQPARKHRDEDLVKSSSMNSLHYSPRDSVAVHSLSPTELSRYASFSMTPRPHGHGPQSSCPLHGHEPGHPHDERNGRHPNLPFDPPHGFHGLHGPHPRLRDELFLRRHSIDRKEHMPPPPHHALEEDLRRRGMDYRSAFTGLPPHLLDEQYRRHLLNGSHEHPSFKDTPHGQVYVPPHFYYGREYPVPVDPYHPHSLPGQSELIHRYGAPPVSPRLMEPYRISEHGVIHNNSRDYEAERRFEERREKESASIESAKRKNEELMNGIRRQSYEHDIIGKEDRRKPNYTVSLDKKPIVPTSNHINHIHSNHIHNNHIHNNHIHNNHIHNNNENKEKTRFKMPIFKGLECNNNNIKQPSKNYGMAHQPNSITSLLGTKLPSSKSELDAASILANMNQINQSPCSDEIESVTSSSGPENVPIKKETVKIEDKENVEVEQSEEKLNYLWTLGLVTHSRKRALEDEYERKRWDRKFRKYRGRPKKRSKRENTEEGSVNGDIRPGSELDFYHGPMTRHKQQLLQEQENLLEQIQKRHSIDNTENNTDASSSEQNNTSEEQPSSLKTRRSPRNSPQKESSTPKQAENSVDNEIDSENNAKPKDSQQTENSRKLTPTSIMSPSSTSVINPTSSTTSVVSKSETKKSIEHHSGRLMAMLKDNPMGPQTSPHSPVHKNHKHSQEQFHHRQSHDRLKRHSSNSNLYSDHVTRPPTNSNHYVDHMEEVKMLDNSLFGRPMEHAPEHYIRWPGVNFIHHAYTAYLKECDLQRQHLLQSYEELQRESRCLHQKREFLEKDMSVYDERRRRIAERRRNMHMTVENVQQALRSMTNL